MSRVGRKPIVLPKGVKVQSQAGGLLVEGPKGKLSTPIPPGISFSESGGQLVFACENAEEQQQRAYFGLARALAQNAVTGVTLGFSKELDIVGVGYRAQVEGANLVLALGFSHPVVYPIPSGIKVAVDRQTHLVVSGTDRQQVGQVAAEIRKLRKPDPYKQKGIRYVGEVLKKKAGKAGATGGAK
jgi:large subunit ribosomal protein L6